MPYTTPVFDFRSLLDTDFAQQIVAPGCSPADGMYEGQDGVQFRTQGAKGRLLQEIVQVTDDGLLLASDSSSTTDSSHEQVVSDTDWVHLQFRVSGGGKERVSNASVIDTPEGCCVVVRYPQDSIVERTARAADSIRVACLMLSPKAITNLLGIHASNLSERALWIVRYEPLEFHATVLSLSSHMRVAVGDILSCPYKGRARRAYMRAKSLELLSSVIHALEVPDDERDHHAVSLSPLDIEKVERARRIMLQELDTSMTLAQLAQRVGLNRTKLALSFKEVYGVSVQTYWRDERLIRARELLRHGKARVTDIALSLGYSETSSFTRAFIRKFGQRPGAVKANGR